MALSKPLLAAMAMFAVVEAARPCRAQEQGFPQAPGFHKLHFQTVIDGQPMDMGYMVYVPKDYDTVRTTRPLVIFLHGVGECGTDYNGLFVHGPATELMNHPKLQDTFESLMLLPQCPPRGQRWDQPAMLKEILALLDVVCQQWRVDQDRIDVTGLSMGGKGTWLLAEMAPQRFAAIAPMSADTLRQDVVDRLHDLAVWGIGGSTDGAVVQSTRAMIQKLRDAGAETRMTFVPGAGHGPDAWDPEYSSPQFYEWLMDHSRSTPETRRQQAARFSRTGQPRQPGHYLLDFQAKPDDPTQDLFYTLYLPKEYAPMAAPRPLLIYFHELGVEGPLIDGLCLHGPELKIEQPGHEHLRDQFPFIVVSPQCPTSPGQWDDGVIAKVSALVDGLVKDLPVDRSRIYVSGLNEGAAATWALAMRTPDRFAAIIPVVAQGSFGPPPGAADALQNVAVFSFMPAGDAASLAAMHDVLARSKAATYLRPVTDAERAEMLECYGAQDLYDWMLLRRRAPTH